MIEELLRETFVRHEPLAPAPDEVRGRIRVLTRRRRRRGYALRGGAAVLALAGLLAAGVVLAPDTVRRTSPVGPLASALPNRPTGPQTVLLLGVDRRSVTPDELFRADTIVLAHLPAGGRRAYAISIPRDAVQPESRGNGQPPHNWDGLRAEVTRLTGVRIDGVVEVDFAGLRAVTDAVGGVEMCVRHRVVSEHRGVDPGGRFRSPRDGGKPIVYEPGCRRFSGEQALDYLRQRTSRLPQGDLDRQRNVRAYLTAMFERLAGADVDELLRVLRAAGGAVRVDVPLFTTVELATALADLPEDALVTIGAPADPNGTLTAGAGPLWAALRGGTLPDWVLANAQHVN